MSLFYRVGGFYQNPPVCYLKAVMNQRLRWQLMFLPLVAGGVFLSLMIHDLKHPAVDQDQCRVVARGLQAAPYKTGANMLYSHGAPPTNDIGFHCERRGVVVINNNEPYKWNIQKDNKATIVHKTYRFLPERWRIDVETGLK